MEDNEKELMLSMTGLLKDADFLALDRELTRFNPFEVLGVKSLEIRHSNMLAWFFDPYGTHGLGRKFLEQFLLFLVSCEDSHSEGRLKKAFNAVQDFSQEDGWNVKVHREMPTTDKRRIDLLVRCFSSSASSDGDSKGTIVILIENKVYSKQGKNQLEDYIVFAEKKFDGALILPVYLTLNEEDGPQGERAGDYFHITYSDIVEILKKLLPALDSEKSGGQQVLFIKQYIEVLEELMGSDSKGLQSMARSIYSRYRAAIEFINSNSTADMVWAGEQFVKANGTLVCSRSNSKAVFFYDEEIKSSKKVNETTIKGDWRGGYPAGYIFSVENDDKDPTAGKLSLGMEVGPFDEKEQRDRFLKILREEGFLLPGTPSPTYTTIYYGAKRKASVKVEDISDAEELAKKMQELFDKEKESRDKLHECLKEFAAEG